MRILPNLLLSTSIAFSKMLADPLNAHGDGVPAERATALENLLSERESETTFAKVIDEARKRGIKEQVILEARFLYHVDRNEDDAIAAMLPDFLKQKAVFKIAESEIFSTEEDWLAVIEYVQAIDSLKKGDKAAFKKHITEAFWLSPRQGSAFAADIERMRLEDAMRSLTIDLNSKLTSLADPSKQIQLSTLISEKKALLFHFWSPWNTECMDSLPDFLITARKLESSNIPVISLLADPQKKSIIEARKTLQPLSSSLPGSWVTDPNELPFLKLMRVQTLPTMVLVSPNGKILFNGHPADDGFWAALAKIDPSVERPQAPEPIKPALPDK